MNVTTGLLALAALQLAPAACADELAVCRRNLLIIYDAVIEHRKIEREYPARLEKLLPDYLTNPNVLVCPAAEAAGDREKYRAGLRSAGELDYFSTYDYELAEKGANPFLRSLGKTPRDYKVRQRELLGDNVPMVRCLRHPGRRLNLSFARQVYESSDYWEVNFRHIVPHGHLLAEWVFSDRLPLHPRLSSRSPLAGKGCVDLSSRYNGHLADEWLSDELRDENSLADFPSGLFLANGIAFDARGVVQLDGGVFPYPFFPDGVTNIVIETRGERIHLLHACAGREQPGVPIALLLVHAEDKTLEIPIRYGIDAADWWYDPANRTTDLPNARVAWTGSNKASARARQAVRLFTSTFALTGGETLVRRIDFVSTRSHSGPFLLALTVQ